MGIESQRHRNDTDDTDGRVRSSWLVGAGEAVELPRSVHEDKGDPIVFEATKSTRRRDRKERMEGAGPKPDLADNCGSRH